METLEPDLDFILGLKKQGGGSLASCFQCGTCSAACDLSPDARPFPRKEMAWANFGMKDRLLTDVDVWLCHQCNDCSTRCPRGAQPGNVLAAVRQASVLHYSFPRILGRWAGRPHCLPLLLGISCLVLTLSLVVRDPIEEFLGIAEYRGEDIVYSYSHLFPQWLLNSLFGLSTAIILLASWVGVARFWKALKGTLPKERLENPSKSLFSSFRTVLWSIFRHEDFAACTSARSRLVSHYCVIFGFLALCVVTVWVITAQINPLIRTDFIYPFAFLSPWKILANVGGGALLVGCLLMIRDRLAIDERVGPGSYFDWFLIGMLFLTTVSGFATELLHYMRLEPHRHVMYFGHLVFIFTLLIYLPYSKFAHMLYRTAALVFADRFNRRSEAIPHPAPHEADADPGANG